VGGLFKWHEQTLESSEKMGIGNACGNPKIGAATEGRIFTLFVEP